MAGQHGTPTPPARGRSTKNPESMLKGSVRGIALVTVATAGVAATAALIAFVVALLYGP